MSLPLVIAYHLVWTAYGWWLGNDPRGSGSKVICCDVLKDLGEVHFGRKRMQPAGWVVREFYDKAATLLKYPLLTFDAAAIGVIGESFQQVVQECKYTCYACAIMPDHIHLIIRKHKHTAEEMIANFQRASHLLLRDRGHRDMEHPVWGGPGWKVFLDHPDELRRVIPNVELNPTKIGLPAQVWPYVTSPYDGWPLHPGHNPNSPWARRMRGT